MQIVEHQLLVLPLDDKLQQTLEAKGKEGWQILAGTQPHVIYQVVRQAVQQPLAEHAGFGAMNIDENQMYFVDKDGKRVDRH